MFILPYYRSTVDPAVERSACKVFVLCLLHFRLMVDREVDVPVLMVLGRSCDLRWRSWAALGAYACGLRLLLMPMLAVLGRS